MDATEYADEIDDRLLGFKVTVSLFTGQGSRPQDMVEEERREDKQSLEATDRGLG